MPGINRLASWLMCFRSLQSVSLDGDEINLKSNVRRSRATWSSLVRHYARKRFVASFCEQPIGEVDLVHMGNRQNPEEEPPKAERKAS